MRRRSCEFRLIPCTLLVALGLLAGCAGDKAAQTTTDADFSTDEERIEYVNSWTAIQIPESATEVRFHLVRWLDWTLNARCLLPTTALDSLVEWLDDVAVDRGVVYKSDETAEYKTLYRESNVFFRRSPGLNDPSLVAGAACDSWGGEYSSDAIEVIEKELARSAHRFGVEYRVIRGDTETFVTIADDSDGTVWLDAHTVAESTRP